MNVVTCIREALLTARKGGDKVAQGILSVVLGEIETLQLSSNQKGAVTDQQIAKIVSKLIKSNEETLGLMKEGDGRLADLEKENQILNGFLPKMWEKADIEKFLVDEWLVNPIQQAANDGQAMGIAMKALKAENAPVQGQDVSEVVKALRV